VIWWVVSQDVFQWARVRFNIPTCEQEHGKVNMGVVRYVWRLAGFAFINGKDVGV
jgi:hypothetical protein